MSVESCVARLVEQKKISKRAGEQALGLYRGMQGHLRDGIPPASGDAHAALEVARILEESARSKKLHIAKQALVHEAAKVKVAAHPKGKVAGVQALLSRDFYGTGTENVETKSEVIFGDLLRRFDTGVTAFKAKLLGLRSAADKQGIDHLVDELFKVDSGNQVARQAAGQWRDTMEHAVTRAKAGGKLFDVLDDWRLPQRWTSAEVKAAGRDAFLGDIRTAVASGGLRVWDEDTADFASGIRLEELIGRAYEDIVADQSGTARAFDPRVRRFRFQDGEAGAAAYKQLMRSYGLGKDLFAPLIDHLRGVSRELALIETLGPEYRASFRALLADAARSQQLDPPKRGIAETIFLGGTGQTSVAATERIFDFLTGRLNIVENEVMAGVFSGLRSWFRLAQLGGAVIAAVPGDSATTLAAAHYNGIPGARVIARAVQGLADDEGQRQIATRIGVVSHAAIETALSAQRYQDELISTAKVAHAGNAAVSMFMRGQGLSAWTESIRRAFTMEFMAHIAENAGKGLDELDRPLRRFLDSYNFSAADWDAIRVAPQLDADGARFFQPSAVADKRLGERLLAAVLDERQFAVIEPTARTAQLNAVGGRAGTFWGELIRSGPLMYKSIPVQMILTHGMRAANQADWGSRAAYGMAVLATTTMAGALSIQAKSLLTGRDPRDMSMPSFWANALITGGALGIYGDLLSTGTTKSGGQAVEALFGPIASLVGQASRASGAVRSAIEDNPRTFGGFLANFGRYNAPGTNLWYTRLGTDRFLFDQVQMMIDPEYARSFRRIEQRAQENYGQDFWFGPGEGAPRRAPELAGMLGAS